MSSILEALKSYADGVASDVKADWSNFPDVEGNANISANVFEDTFSSSHCYAVIKATGQKAWILEHGSGSKMDDEIENPDLPEYKRSEYWNKEREGTEIRTRRRSIDGKGWGYLDLDDNPHRGSGIAMPHGLNAEKLRGNGHGPAIAHEPQHIIQKQLTNTGRQVLLESKLDNILEAEIDLAITRNSEAGQRRIR